MFTVVHFLNQFFAGVGGEEKAHIAPEVREGAVGPAKGLQLQFADKARIKATVLCGDNFFGEHAEDAKAQ